MLVKTDGYRFEDFVERCNRLSSSQRLFEEFTAAMASFGFDRIIFSVPRDADLRPQDNGIGLMHNYPSDWQAYYTEKDFARIDPVLKAAGTHGWAFRWKDIERTHNLSDRQTRVMRLGEEAGLHNGIGIPLRGPRAQIAGIAMASSHPHDAALPKLDLITAYCQQFYMSFKRIGAPRQKPLAIVASLSPKEEEILLWVAAGRSDDQIAAILSISANTVDTHLRHIFQKLEVNNRVGAVVKAIMAGLINP